MRAEEKLQELFNANSSEEVAELLRRHGVKGVPGEIDACPIANYLNKRMKRRYFTVVPFETYLNLPFQNSHICLQSWRNPDPVSEFIVEFDLCKYPDLVSG